MKTITVIGLIDLEMLLMKRFERLGRFFKMYMPNVNESAEDKQYVVIFIQSGQIVTKNIMAANEDDAVKKVASWDKRTDYDNYKAFEYDGFDVVTGYKINKKEIYDWVIKIAPSSFLAEQYAKKLKQINESQEGDQ